MQTATPFLRWIPLLTFLLAAAAPAQDLVITGVVDGPLTGGTPKAVELYALENVDDLSLYAVGSANNGGGTDGPEFVLSGSASAGDYLYLASEADQFDAFFGFAPTFVDGAASINGDDAIELFYDEDGFGSGEAESVIDVFGDINTDGNGEAWEYLDGWAYRADGTGPDGTTFTLDNWTFSGPDALDDAPSNSEAATPFPIGTYSGQAGAPVATVTFDDQTSSGSAVVIASVFLPEDGYVAIHDSTLLDGNVAGSVIGVSDYLEGGTYADLVVTLFDVPGQDFPADTALADDQTLIAMPHEETSGDMAYSFITSEGAEDGPYFNENDPGQGAVTDAGFVTIQEAVSIAKARALGAGTTVMVTGTVTRSMGAFTYLQDGTAGLTIRQTSGDFFDAVADGTIAPGTEITVSGELSEFANLLQINGGDLASFEIGEDGDVPEPQGISLQEIADNGEAYEGELVTVGGLATDSTGTFEAGTSYTVADGTATDTLRVPNADDSDIDGTAIPPASFTFTGVVGQFSFDGPDLGYQLLAIAEGDVEADPPATVAFDDQTSGGFAIVVSSVFVPRDGYVAIHDSTLLDGNVAGSVIGVSDYLEGGTYADLVVTLFDVPGQDFPADTALADDQTLIAMPHEETSGDMAYSFVTSGGTEDGPFFVNDDPEQGAVIDAGFVTIETATIAEARTLGVGATVTVTGTVTRSMGAFTYLQDGTAGLTIRQTSGDFFDAVADGTIAPGTEVTVSGELSEFASLLQINDSDLSAYSVGADGDVPEPQEVTLEELSTSGEDYEAELVEVSDLFILPNGDEVFQAATTYEVLKGDLQLPITLRVPNAEDTAIDGIEIPDGRVLFTGVIGQFDFDDPTVGYQLLAIQEDDITVDPFVAGEETATPGEFALRGNYPNPFGASTTIRYDLPTDARVGLEVFDVLGRRVLEIEPDAVPSGADRSFVIDAPLPSGAYVYRLTAEMADGTRVETGRMTVVR